MNDKYDALKNKCCKCKKNFHFNKLIPFQIPLKTCAITHEVIAIQDIPVYICQNCIEEYGKPEYIDMHGEIHYDKGEYLFDEILNKYFSAWKKLAKL